MFFGLDSSLERSGYRATLVLLAVLAAGLVLLFGQADHRSQRTTLLAVSRDQGLLTGGIGPGPATRPGAVQVEPLAFLSGNGVWSPLPCPAGGGAGCGTFEREFLSKPHSYGVISADGRGAQVTSFPTKLSECFGFEGNGVYRGAAIAHMAVASSSPGEFASPAPLSQLRHREAARLLEQSKPLLPKSVGDLDDTRVFRTALQGHQLLVLQRTFADSMGTDPEEQSAFFILANQQGKLSLLQRIVDDEQSILATIRTASGRDFLITVAHDSESQFFVVYGFRGGKLVVVFNGGGNSC